MHFVHASDFFRCDGIVDLGQCILTFSQPLPRSGQGDAQGLCVPKPTVAKQLRGRKRGVRAAPEGTAGLAPRPPWACFLLGGGLAEPRTEL